MFSSEKIEHGKKLGFSQFFLGLNNSTSHHPKCGGLVQFPGVLGMQYMFHMLLAKGRGSSRERKGDLPPPPPKVIFLKLFFPPPSPYWVPYKGRAKNAGSGFQSFRVWIELTLFSIEILLMKPSVYPSTDWT